MNVLIYCAHPAQYHFQKNIIHRLSEKGHIIKLLIRSKDILENLIKEDGLDYENIFPVRNKNDVLSRMFSMLLRDWKLLKVAQKFKPDILLGADTCITHVGWLLRKPAYGIGEDDFHIVRKLDLLMLPFARGILAPAVCKMGPFEKKKIAFDGYMKLAYLHPEVFTPDKTKIKITNPEKPYCLIRLVKLSAHHDSKMKGLNGPLVRNMVQKLASLNYNVFIDAEENLPPDLAVFRPQIMKNSWHHLMAFASLIISDSQSITVEAAMLGVPSIRFNDFAGKISVLEELEHKYGLTFGIKPPDEESLTIKMNELLAMPDLKGTFRKRQNQMLQEKINVLDFFVWFIDRYPKSRELVHGKLADLHFMNTFVCHDHERKQFETL